jgi:ketosteroid isomerase-like protein
VSEHNVEIVRRGYEAFSRGDITAMFAAVDPEVVTYTAPPLLPPGEYFGLEGMLEWIGGWTEGFEEFSLVPEEYVDAGECVLARIRQVVTGASSGIPLERDFWFLHQMRDGNIVRMGVHPTREDAERAAGSA